MYNRAVSPFAASTFQDFCAFILQNKRLGKWQTLRPGGYFTIEGNEPPRRYSFEVVFGPPYDTTVHNAAETGPRTLGDEYCWTIMRNHYGT